MVEILALLLVITLASYVIEKTTKIPLPLNLVTLSLLLKIYFPHLLIVDDKNFDDLLIMLLPIVLLPDILNIHLNDMKNNWKPIVYFSVFTVIFTMIVGALISYYFVFNTTVSLAALIALYSILSATDAVSVLNVFGKFNLPHKLKIIAEGDSLGNDPVAIILFKLVGLSLLAGNSLGQETISGAVSIFAVAIFVGGLVGFIGYLILKYFDDKDFEIIVIYTTAVLSFIVAEHFHSSGILSVIVAIGFLKFMVELDLEKIENRIYTIQQKGLHGKIVSILQSKIAMREEHFNDNKSTANFIALIANSFIFIFMAFSIDLNILLKYSSEILIVFVLLLILRAILSTLAVKMLGKPLSWAFVLTMAGIKGGLSLIMVHSLPNFEHKEMLTAIVVGNVILSTYINTFSLMAFLKFNKKMC